MADWAFRDWVLLVTVLVSVGGLFSQLVINLAMRDRDRADFVKFADASEKDRKELRDDIQANSRAIERLRGRLDNRKE